jgi:predicted ATP-dependent serine protease
MKQINIKVTKKPRKAMSPEARARISEGMKRRAELKQIQEGANPKEKKVLNAKPVELVKMKDEKFSPDLFVPMRTGKSIDKILSNDGGLNKAVNFMVVGDPGVGKSTVTLDILADLQSKGFKTLFISQEMNRIDLYQYVQRYPKFGEVPTLFMSEYIDSNPKDILEQVIDEGFDIVLMDSFVEVLETVKEASGMGTRSTEKFLVDLMIKNNLGENKTKTNTSFLVIQQVGKDGTFVGSNKLKHALTGMMELRYDKSGGSYIFFCKNRRGPVNKKMYFSLKESGDVHYDDRRFSLDQESKEFLDEEKKRLEEEEDAFDTLFGTGSLDAPENDGTDYIRR